MGVEEILYQLQQKGWLTEHDALVLFMFQIMVLLVIGIIDIVTLAKVHFLEKRCKK